MSNSSFAQGQRQYSACYGEYCQVAGEDAPSSTDASVLDAAQLALALDEKQKSAHAASALLLAARTDSAAKEAAGYRFKQRAAPRRLGRGRECPPGSSGPAWVRPERTRTGGTGTRGTWYPQRTRSEKQQACLAVGAPACEPGTTACRRSPVRASERGARRGRTTMPTEKVRSPWSRASSALTPSSTRSGATWRTAPKSRKATRPSAMRSALAGWGSACTVPKRARADVEAHERVRRLRTLGRVGQRADRRAVDPGAHEHPLVAERADGGRDVELLVAPQGPREAALGRGLVLEVELVEDALADLAAAPPARGREGPRRAGG
jgi:hypothetical protein